MRPQAATLRLAIFPQAGLVTDIVLACAGALFMAAAAQVSIPLPFTPVPITGQTFAAVLIGASLGSLLGLASLSLYVLLGLAGAPFYADGSSGLETFLGPTGGYIVSFVVAATVTGLLAERRWDQRFPSAVAAMLTGNVLIYACGLPWLALEIDTGFEETLELGLYPFIVGDLLKLYLAAALLPLAWKSVERHGLLEGVDRVLI